MIIYVNSYRRSMRKNILINKIYKWILNEVFKEDTLNLKNMEGTFYVLHKSFVFNRKNVCPPAIVD